jgi:DNA transformation protein
MSKPSRAAADEFRDYCRELFDTLSPHAGIAGIAARKMFGGSGFSIDGKTFAIIAMDQLWLKVDDESRSDFEQAGCQIFTYDMAGKPRSMSYYTVPPDAMESAAMMRPWAELAWGAALRAAAQKTSKKAARKTPAATASAAKPRTLAGKTTKVKKTLSR